MNWYASNGKLEEVYTRTSKYTFEKDGTCTVVEPVYSKDPITKTGTWRVEDKGNDKVLSYDLKWTNQWVDREETSSSSAIYVIEGEYWYSGTGIEKQSASN